MKWYYEWRLRRVRAEIAALEQETRARLVDNYTAHSRLRVLKSLADGLQKRLARRAAASAPAAPTAKAASVAQAAPMAPAPAGSKEAC